MVTFKPKQRDLAMRIICDYYADENNIDPISTEDLYNFGLQRTINAAQLVNVLKAMGYVATKSYYEGPDTILLTDSGRCYFERKDDLMREKRIEWFRYIITTVIAVAALITAIVSICLQYK